MSENGWSGGLVPEEFGRSPSLVADYETFLPASLDFKYFHHGTIAGFDVPENILIDFEGVVRRFFEENRIRDSPDIGLAAKRLGRLGRGNEEVRCGLTHPCE